MMKITDIEINKKFKATFKGYSAIVNYRMREDWASFYYYDKEGNFILKTTHNVISEQRIIERIREFINDCIETNS